jgi:hypothetical protein
LQTTSPPRVKSTVPVEKNRGITTTPALKTTSGRLKTTVTVMLQVGQSVSRKAWW